MTDKILLSERLKKVVAACQALAKVSWQLSHDKATDQFCRQYLSKHLNLAALEAKVANELGDKCYSPLGRVLFIISENDILGTTLGFLAAYITGNQMVIKARQSQPILQFLKEQLALTNEEVCVYDWLGGEQDDQTLLHSVNAVVLAGSEQLINHFRKQAPYPIRLIEFGPKLSAIAIGEQTPIDIEAVAKDITLEATLFLQQVCTSPRFIMVESMQTSQQLMQALKDLLPSLPIQDTASLLAGHSRIESLKLLQRINPQLQAVAFANKTGWGITLTTELNPALWCTQGFNLVVGDIDSLLQAATARWPNRLQTLALAGYQTFGGASFSRLCPLGTMHYRPLIAPHDGFFELAALVSFVSKEVP